MGILGKLNAARTAAQDMTPGGIAWAVFKAVWPYALALIVLAGIAWKLWHAGYDEAVKDEAKARGELTAQRDDAVRQRNATVAANGNLASSEQAMRDALAVATAENQRLGTQRQAALDEAETARHQADQTFAQWQARNAATFATANCQTALANLARACPVKDF